MNNFERRALRIERTGTTPVHSRGLCKNNLSYSVVDGAVLCKASTVCMYGHHI